MINIVFLDRYTVGGSDLSPVRALGNYTEYDSTDEGQVLERCAEADVIIANKTPLRAATLGALPRLKLVCIAATGMNNIDLEAAAAAGIEVRNAVDYSTDSVAEATFCGVLALMKQSLYYDNYVKSGAYAASGRIFDFGRSIGELHSKRWGIIGLGNIGRRVAAIATAFGARVCYYSTSGANISADYPRFGLEELLASSDVVSIHAPLNRNTYNLIDYSRLCMMKPTALLCNVARGNIVNEQALARALNEGRIAGAALDVFGKEPMLPDNPLLSIDDPYKLFLSPHTAWSSSESLQRLVGKVAGNITSFFAWTVKDLP